MIGGGPAGAACAYWAAKSGLDVLVVEKKSFPREKTCGDGLTPRAIRQLEDMEVLNQLSHFHRHQGLRARAANRVLELPWPNHPEFPNYGLCVRRRDLDQLVLGQAEKAGAEIMQGTEAVQVTSKNGDISGVELKQDQTSEQISARFIAVADGANSRIGRSLGTQREKSWPQGMAIRTYYESKMDKDPWLESDLDIRSKDGKSVPGYGWIFPLGDGTVNVGVGLLSTFKDYKKINTSRLMESWADAVDESWEIDPLAPCMDPVGGRLPMGGSVSPKSGSNWLIIGDAAGFVNPFNGEGIDYAYETGRKAAELFSANEQNLELYSRWIKENYELYFKIARLFAKVIGRPAIIKQLTGAGMRSKSLMEWALKIMANLLHPDEKGPAELAYSAISQAVKRLN